MKRLIVMFTMLVMAQGLSAIESKQPILLTGKDMLAFTGLVTAKSCKFSSAVCSTLGLTVLTACIFSPKDSDVIAKASMAVLGGYAANRFIFEPARQQCSSMITRRNLRKELEVRADSCVEAGVISAALVGLYQFTK